MPRQRFSPLASYFEDVFWEIVDSTDEEDRAAWFLQFFDLDGKELWEGMDALKEEVDTIVEMLDLDRDFRRAIWQTIDFHELMEVLKEMRKEIVISDGE